MVSRLSSLFTSTLLLTIFPLISCLPPGFIDEGVNRWQRVTDIETIPPPTNWPSASILIVTLKHGEVHILKDPDNNPDQSLLATDLSDRLCANGERGLEAVAVHPNFLSNRFIYLYYTYKGTTSCEESRTRGPVNRCSRFVVRADYTIDLSTERVLFQTTPLAKRIHNGGDMVFGHDGNLYVTTGDGGMSKGSRISQNNSDLLGTLIRITPNGDIPRDNPFASDGVRCAATGKAVDSTSPCQEIYAWGLRNPFKMAMDPNTDQKKTRLYVNDVGGRTWEEANLAGTDFAKANYGWPEREGPCSGFGNAGDNIEGCEPDPRYQDPEHFYLHRDKSGLGGGAIVGGAFVPNGFWPSEYDNSYMFADFVFGEIYHLTPGQSCRNCGMWGTPVSKFRNETFHTFESTSALHFAPLKNTMALYYGAQRLSPFTLRRIVYVGGTNTAPKASLQVSKSLAVVGEAIQFDGRSSTDADGDRLSFAWDFGDGKTGGGRITNHMYTEKGKYTAKLTVSDGNGGQNKAFIDVSVGSPPDVKIVSPREGTQFSVGEQFVLSGAAVDGNGELIPPASLTWEVRRHHATHWHPFLSPTNGERIELLPAPSPEDLLAATNSHLEVRLTATDADGLTSTVSRILNPKTVELTFTTQPPGVDLSVDDFRVKTPHKVLSWENHQLKVTALGDSRHTFLSWSDGGEQDHAIVVKRKKNANAIEYTATFHELTYWSSILQFLRDMTGATSTTKESNLRTTSSSHS